MKINLRRRVVVLGPLIVVLLGVVWWQFREPTYQGKPLNYWIEQMIRHVDSQAAEAALREIGPRAIPLLLARNRYERSEFQRWYRAAYPQWPIIIQHRLPAPKPNTGGIVFHAIH